MVVLIKTSEWGDVTGVEPLNYLTTQTRHLSQPAYVNYPEIRPETIAVDITLDTDATDNGWNPQASL